MKLTWLGHSCFLLEQDGCTILLDPYTGVDGYPSLTDTAARCGVPMADTPDGPKIAVNRVLCSHGHGDHHAVELTAPLPEVPCPFTIRTVETFHDGQGGALRGRNTIHILTAGGASVAHLGDLGHVLTPEQAAAIGPLDAVMIPVGGYYTIDAREARAVCDQLAPRCVVPMHYRRGTRGYPVLAEVEDFLALWPAAEVRRLEGPALETGASGVVVPGFQEVN